MSQKPQFLDAELGYLKCALQNNGYSAIEVRRAAQPRRSGELDESVSLEFIGLAILPYIQGLTDHIGRLLSR